MKTHLFQRYHGKENVATANTMLLLSRLYAYSPDKFFGFLKSEYFGDSFDPGLVFNLQEKGKNSVLDATITQEGFKIAVETKLFDWFYEDQLLRHLDIFGDVKNKVFITLAPEWMEAGKKAAFEEKLKQYNATQRYPVIHINTTFDAITKAIRNILDDRDYDMQEILDDYLDYCYTDGLIPGHDAYKYMRVQLAGQTFDFNVRTNVYYDDARRGFRAHDTLGLYKDKRVRAIGKVIARITAVETEGGIKYNAEFGELTDERKELISEAMKNGDSLRYDLRTVEHRYFFVDKFYETDFEKTTPYAPMGSRVFDLTEVLGTDKIPNDTKALAEKLKGKSWS